MALAVMLLMGAGLLIRSFGELLRVPAGFDAEHAVTFRVALQGSAYSGVAPIRARVAELEERLRALPGVRTVAVTTVLPFGGRGGLVDFAVEGAPPPPENVNREIAIGSVTPGYFDAIGTPLRSGRALTAADTAEAPLAALINETAVARWFDGRDPLGRVALISGQRWTIVGVVGDVLQRDPSTPVAPMIFTPFAQRTTRTIRVVLRTAGDPMSQAGAIRGVVRSLDPDLAITAFAPLTDLSSAS
jgi:putative ABC transport system permease protein